MSWRKHCPKSQASSCTRKKNQTWNRTGIPPEAIEELGEDVWQHVTVLGTHRVGMLWENGRTHHESKGLVGSHAPQCKTFSAPHEPHDAHDATRVLCMLSTHNEAIWATVKVLFHGLQTADETAHQLATLPTSNGGLGFSCEVRSSGVLSLADATRTPEVADEVVRKLGPAEFVVSFWMSFKQQPLTWTGRGWRPLNCTWADVHRPVNPANGHTGFLRPRHTLEEKLDAKPTCARTSRQNAGVVSFSRTH